jgi:hypothetical protein
MVNRLSIMVTSSNGFLISVKSNTGICIMVKTPIANKVVEKCKKKNTSASQQPIYLAYGNRTRARTWKILTFTQHRFGEVYRGAVHAACQHGCQFHPLFSGLFDETGCLSPIPVQTPLKVRTGYQYLRLTRGVSTGIRSTTYY